MREAEAAQGQAGKVFAYILTPGPTGILGFWSFLTCSPVRVALMPLFIQQICFGSIRHTRPSERSQE